MSFRPDYSYRPIDRTGALFVTPPPPETPEERISRWDEARTSFKGTSSILQDSVIDADMRRYMVNTLLLFKTGTNALDSVAFLEKFGYAFSETIRMTYPDIRPDILRNLEDDFMKAASLLRDSLGTPNIENTYLLPLTLAMVDSTINYDNY